MGSSCCPRFGEIWASNDAKDRRGAAQPSESRHHLRFGANGQRIMSEVTPTLQVALLPPESHDVGRAVMIWVKDSLARALIRRRRRRRKLRLRRDLAPLGQIDGWVEDHPVAILEPVGHLH